MHRLMNPPAPVTSKKRDTSPSDLKYINALNYEKHVRNDESKRIYNKIQSEEDLFQNTMKQAAEMDRKAKEDELKAKKAAQEAEKAGKEQSESFKKMNAEKDSILKSMEREGDLHTQMQFDKSGNPARSDPEVLRFKSFKEASDFANKGGIAAYTDSSGKLRILSTPTLQTGEGKTAARTSWSDKPQIPSFDSKSKANEWSSRKGQLAVYTKDGKAYISNESLKAYGDSLGLHAYATPDGKAEVVGSRGFLSKSDLSSAYNSSLNKEAIVRNPYVKNGRRIIPTPGTVKDKSGRPLSNFKEMEEPGPNRDYGKSLSKTSTTYSSEAQARKAIQDNNLSQAFFKDHSGNYHVVYQGSPITYPAKESDVAVATRRAPQTIGIKKGGTPIATGYSEQKINELKGRHFRGVEHVKAYNEATDMFGISNKSKDAFARSASRVRPLDTPAEASARRANNFDPTSPEMQKRFAEEDARLNEMRDAKEQAKKQAEDEKIQKRIQQKADSEVNKAAKHRAQLGRRAQRRLNQANEEIVKKQEELNKAKIASGGKDVSDVQKDIEKLKKTVADNKAAMARRLEQEAIEKAGPTKATQALDRALGRKGALYMPGGARVVRTGTRNLTPEELIARKEKVTSAKLKTEANPEKVVRSSDFERDVLQDSEREAKLKGKAEGERYLNQEMNKGAVKPGGSAEPILRESRKVTPEQEAKWEAKATAKYKAQGLTGEELKNKVAADVKSKGESFLEHDKYAKNATTNPGKTAESYLDRERQNLAKTLTNAKNKNFHPAEGNNERIATFKGVSRNGLILGSAGKALSYLGGKAGDGLIGLGLSKAGKGVSTLGKFTEGFLFDPNTTRQMTSAGVRKLQNKFSPVYGKTAPETVNSFKETRGMLSQINKSIASGKLTEEAGKAAKEAAKGAFKEATGVVYDQMAGNVAKKVLSRNIANRVISNTAAGLTGAMFGPYTLAASLASIPMDIKTENERRMFDVDNYSEAAIRSKQREVGGAFQALSRMYDKATTPEERAKINAFAKNKIGYTIDEYKNLTETAEKYNKDHNLTWDAPWKTPRGLAKLIGAENLAIKVGDFDPNLKTDWRDTYIPGWNAVRELANAKYGFDAQSLDDSTLYDPVARMLAHQRSYTPLTNTVTTGLNPEAANLPAWSAANPANQQQPQQPQPNGLVSAAPVMTPSVLNDKPLNVTNPFK